MDQAERFLIIPVLMRSCLLESQTFDLFYGRILIRKQTKLEIQKQLKFNWTIPLGMLKWLESSQILKNC